MEIKKNKWSHFCKKFSAANQYRSVVLSLKSQDCEEYDVLQDSIFTGILINRKGRLIRGIDVFIDQSDPDRLMVPAMSIENPVEFVLNQGKDGADQWLTIEGKNGIVASFIFNGSASHQKRQAWIEKLAYTFSERRGFAPGNDLGDWLNAERAIGETERLFI